MPKAVLSEEDFIRMFREMGAAGMARKLGMRPTTVLARRRAIEARLNTNIVNPVKPLGVGGNLHAKQVEHPARQHFSLQDGVVLIGSDAHYWPGEASTAHRAFVKFCKELKPDAVVLNGDVLDGASVSRHPPIGWENRPTLVDEIIACQTRLREIVKAAPKAKTYWTLGNHDCHKNDTQCLTKRGWMHYEDIRSDDQILSLDGGRAVWTGIDEIVVYPYSGEMVEINKLRMSMSVTPNHRVLLNRRDWRTGRIEILDYVPAASLPYAFSIPTSGVSGNPEHDISDDEITLAGWMITDGNFHKGSVSIYQSKAEGRLEIEGVLSRLGLKYSHYVRDRDITEICGRQLVKSPMPEHQYRLSADSSRVALRLADTRERLPDWADDLSDRQFDVLLSAIIAGNGLWDGDPDRRNCCVLYGIGSFLDSVQAAAVRHGWRARFAVDNRGDDRLWLTRKSGIVCSKPDIEVAEYEGMVWCLRVPHGNFMVRRDGCAYFSGNSRFETRIATVAPEFAKIHGVHLKDHFGDNWINCWSLWINDEVVVKHRWKGGTHATHNNTLGSGKTMVTGHLHSLKVTPYTDYNGSRYGVDCGTLAETNGNQFVHYTEDNPVSWRSGFAVLTFHKGHLLLPELVQVRSPEEVEFRGKVWRV